jgi:hypothetical protein
MMECFPTRRLAEIAEAYAIESEGPLENLLLPTTPSLVKERGDWYLETTGWLLVGKDRRFTRAHCQNSTEIEQPDCFTPPEPCSPRFRPEPERLPPGEALARLKVICKASERKKRSPRPTPSACVQGGAL